MVNHTRMLEIQNGNGGVQECLVEEQIIGEEFLYASDQRILKEEALTDWAMEGEGDSALLLNFTNIDSQDTAATLGRRISRLI